MTGASIAAARSRVLTATASVMMKSPIGRWWFFFSSRRRHTRSDRDWSSDVCSSDLEHQAWLSVEILHPEAASAANYRIVAQVIAELLSVDCLALFHPESRKLVPAHASEKIGRASCRERV